MLFLLKERCLFLTSFHNVRNMIFSLVSKNVFEISDRLRLIEPFVSKFVEKVQTFDGVTTLGVKANVGAGISDLIYTEVELTLVVNLLI